MRVGVRELKERLSELLNGDQLLTVTNNGRVIGEFTPATVIPPTLDREEWLSRRIAARRRWQEEVPDWSERLTGADLDAEGEPFAEPTFR